MNVMQLRSLAGCEPRALQFMVALWPGAAVAQSVETCHGNRGVAGSSRGETSHINGLFLIILIIN